MELLDVLFVGTNFAKRAYCWVVLTIWNLLSESLTDCSSVKFSELILKFISTENTSRQGHNLGTVHLYQVYTAKGVLLTQHNTCSNDHCPSNASLLSTGRTN